MTIYKCIQANNAKNDALVQTGRPTPTELNNLNCGMARIYCDPSAVSSNFADQVAYAQSLANAGIEPLPYFEPASSNPTDATFITWMDKWIAALGPYCSWFESLNEPDRTSTNLGTDGNSRRARAIYLYRLVVARFHNAGKKLLLSASGQGTATLVTQAASDSQAPAGGTSGPMFSGASPVASDGVAIHIYRSAITLADDPSNSVISRFNEARAVVPSTIGLWITETGNGTDGKKSPDATPATGTGPLHEGYEYAGPPENVLDGAPTSNSFQHSETGTNGQDAYVTKLAAALWPLRNSPNNVKCWSWYQWKDTGNGSGSDNQYEVFGLRHTEKASIAPNPGSKKPSWQAFANEPAFMDPAAGPVATTSTPATNIGQTTATVSGTVDPNLTQTTRYFDYGTTVAYGSTTTGAAVGAGDVSVPVTASLTGLSPGTTYHYRCRAVSTAGSSSGVDRTFTTTEVPLPPSVTTGSATGINLAGATLNGIVDPNLVATTAYFEYGPTTSYGSRTPATDINVGSGTSPVSVSAPITGLTVNTTYHYRLRATNAQGTTLGADQTFTVTPPAVSAAISKPALIPLELTVEAETADGRTYRWELNHVDFQNRLLAAPSFSSQAGDGFAEATCVVSRPIDIDWPDLNLLNRFKFIGADGSVAYEGRSAALPRRVDSSGEIIEVQLQGLMSSARDRSFMEIFVDRSGDRWLSPSLNLRKAHMNADDPLDADYNVSVGAGSIHFKGTTRKVIPAGSQTMVQYRAPSGIKLKTFQYTGTQRNTSSGDYNPVIWGTDNDATVGGMGQWDENQALTLPNPADGLIQTATMTTAWTFLGLRHGALTEHGDATHPNTPGQRRFDKIAVYSNHGVTLRSNGDEPDGVYASDVIANIIDRFCPLLNSDGVEQSGTVISHLVFDTPTAPFDAFTLLNGYHLWNLGAWENGTVVFGAADLTSADWHVRRDAEGVSLDLQGDSSDQLANGIVVSYTDVDERQIVLWPTDFDELTDDDPDNPANKQGIELWISLELSTPADQKGALALGAAALGEFNRPKAPGTVNVGLGYIEDAQGNLQPGWKVRAGQTLSIIDLPNDIPRLITQTSWGEDGSLSITLEQPSSRVDAVLARLELASQVGSR